MKILLKRVYDKPGEEEGLRILVDRLWPRGLAKDQARIDVWLKAIAPSDTLRRWFQHDAEKWPEFKRRYFSELDQATAAVDELRGYARGSDVVLLYAARDTVHNNATALQEYLSLHLAQ